MAQHEAWQVGGSAAELYQRYLVPAIASLWAADLIDRAAPRPGERVLDVACGTGVVSRLAAERMGSGRVLASISKCWDACRRPIADFAFDRMV